MTLPGLDECLKEWDLMKAKIKAEKVQKPNPKAVFKITARKIILDWWNEEGSQSFKAWVKRNFFRYIEVS